MNQVSSIKATMKHSWSATRPELSQKMGRHLSIPAMTKLAKQGPMYGEAIYNVDHKPIFRALSWKKKQSLRKAIAMVCGAVRNQPIKARIA